MANLFSKTVFVTSFVVVCSQYAAAQSTAGKQDPCGPSAAEQKRAGDARAAQLQDEIEQDYKAGRLESAIKKEAEYRELMTKEYKEPQCEQKKDTGPGGIR